MPSQPSICPCCGSFDIEDFRCNSCGHAIEHTAISRICPQCGSKNRDRSQFCAECGAPLFEYCPQCGGKMATTARFCERCAFDYARIHRSEQHCQWCGAQNPVRADLCRECGARLRTRCPQCGTTTEAQYRFCPLCGFDRSRFVSEKLLAKLDTQSGTPEESAFALDLSSGFMIILTIISIILDAYILSQI